jgi:hypothetical protein
VIAAGAGGELGDGGAGGGVDEADALLVVVAAADREQAVLGAKARGISANWRGSKPDQRQRSIAVLVSMMRTVSWRWAVGDECPSGLMATACMAIEVVLDDGLALAGGTSQISSVGFSLHDGEGFAVGGGGEH